VGYLPLGDAAPGARGETSSAYGWWWLSEIKKTYPIARSGYPVASSGNFETYAYRRWIDPTVTGANKSVYWASAPYRDYIYIDYHKAVTGDVTVLPSSMWGKSIRVVDSLNLAFTQTQVPQSGLVLSTTGESTYGYIVLELSSLGRTPLGAWVFETEGVQAVETTSITVPAGESLVVAVAYDLGGGSPIVGHIEFDDEEFTANAEAFYTTPDHTCTLEVYRLHCPTARTGVIRVVWQEPNEPLTSLILASSIQGIVDAVNDRGPVARGTGTQASSGTTTPLSQAHAMALAFVLVNGDPAVNPLDFAGIWSNGQEASSFEVGTNISLVEGYSIRTNDEAIAASKTLLNSAPWAAACLVFRARA
jgi:hypothetical protein